MVLHRKVTESPQKRAFETYLRLQMVLVSQTVQFPSPLTLERVSAFLPTRPPTSLVRAGRSSHRRTCLQRWSDTWLQCISIQLAKGLLADHGCEMDVAREMELGMAETRLDSKHGFDAYCDRDS